MNVPEFAIALPNGRTETGVGLAIQFTDSHLMRRVGATVAPMVARGDRPPQMLPIRPRHILLWADDAYDAAGDYTQAQVEARVLEVLGDLGTAFTA